MRYMQDLKNARLMNQAPTGNGRRQSFRHDVMPRMTNTFMRAGTATREEMIESVHEGLYVVSLGGGEVDPASGRFVFDVSEAYKIRDGKLGAGVKGAVMAGSGPELMQRIDMIGDDLEIFRETGMCGKSGQKVPVTVGQPSVRMHGVMVGGTDAGPK